jgi:homoserine kinase
MATVTVRVPATTANLGSGFDALGAALAWHSFVALSAPHEGIVVEVTGEVLNMSRTMSATSPCKPSRRWSPTSAQSERRRCVRVSCCGWTTASR